MQFDISLITANNGWAMAVTGALIVMCGLSVLSLIISQLHKVVGLFEQKPVTLETETPKPAGLKLKDVDLLNDLPSTAKLYQAVSTDLGEQFTLNKLYAVSREQNLPHTHITIRSFREAGLLVPVGDDLFTWKN